MNKPIVSFDGVDVEKLHETIDNAHPTARGIGRTLSSVIRLVHEAQLGDSGNLYLYVGDTHHYATKEVRRWVHEFMTNEGIDVTIGSVNDLIVHKDGDTQRFFFTGPHDLDRWTRGHPLTYSIIDVYSYNPIWKNRDFYRATELIALRSEFFLQ